MGRPCRSHLSMGVEVLQLREQKVTWKEICARFGYGRTRLTQLMKIARAQRAQDGGPKPNHSARKDVHEHLQPGQARLAGPTDGRLRREARLLGRHILGAPR